MEPSGIWGQAGTVEAVTTKTGSFAATFRPRRFSEVVGQRHVVAPLRRAVASNSLPHQLLFVGSSGLGKTTLARVTAAALLCDARVDDEPCGVCDSCLDLFTPGAQHPDVAEFDAASNGNKDDIREIAQRATLAPMRGAFRVMIIDEAHGLSASGGQAFLKLLEEPPPHVIFMLATTDPQKMLATNRSRCIEFELLAPTAADMAENLTRVARSADRDIAGDVALEVVDATDPALGVRGTVMLLEKLLVASEGDVTLSEAAELLGRPPAQQVNELMEALDTDLGCVFASFDVLRARFTTSSIMRRCAQEASDRLVAAATSGNVAAVGVHGLRLNVLLAAAASSSNDLSARAALAQCVRSERVEGFGVAIDVAALEGRIAALNDTVASLEQRLDGHAATATTPAVHVAPAVKEQPAAQPKPDVTSPDVQGKAAVVKVVEASAGSGSGDIVVGVPAELPVLNLGAFLTLLARADNSLPAVVRRGGVVIDDVLRVITVHYLPAAARKLFAAAAVLDNAASQLAATCVLVEKPGS